MITVQAGEPFNVDIRATPATGYQWCVAGVPSGIELLNDAFVVDLQNGSPAPIPSSGTHRFHFLAVETGRVEVRFVLKRTWETEALEQRVEVVEVRP
ncbi:protease inhibitor I42 family protein [Arthrobacter sp. H35-D1]|uniref:protease inhibitor I42 family protein n=1 Tax=Arthrobacter sp. H35-D1 TaxID=3046202 RepID=UPI0024B98509|nr:protease inhibitor I42 family protein [Arthrobacter sp. H35-D1]MDJ0313489.1 protease inhibitor I42 family protein [Arthrobacter sp. H35-D1]